jgi:hypothetical protein
MDTAGDDLGARSLAAAVEIRGCVRLLSDLFPQDG